jgi:hypothetical protein
LLLKICSAGHIEKQEAAGLTRQCLIEVWLETFMAAVFKGLHIADTDTILSSQGS